MLGYGITVRHRADSGCGGGAASANEVACYGGFILPALNGYDFKPSEILDLLDACLEFMVNKGV